MMLYDPKWANKRAKIYSQAADLIRDRGHSIGRLANGRGEMCLWGAISFALHGNAYACSKESYAMVNALSIYTKGESPVKWNNQPGRTKIQVVRLLRRAAREVAHSRETS